ncbi:MAG: MoaD family protein [Methylococcaceae bacterium]|nr:MoaD family protein [Methylococcaceae bacterium]
MSITVNIPTILRPLTQDQKRVEATGSKVSEIIEQLEQQYAGIKEKVMADDQVHRFINIYVNDDDIRFTEGLETAVKAGDSITILPSVAGG